MQMVPPALTICIKKLVCALNYSVLIVCLRAALEPIKVLRIQSFVLSPRFTDQI